MLAHRRLRNPAARLGFLILITLAGVHHAFAQITAATISGTVKDETGGVLPGVDVVVTNVDTGLIRASVTDANGYFTLPGLPPGTYETRASCHGLRHRRRTASCWWWRSRRR